MPLPMSASLAASAVRATAPPDPVAAVVAITFLQEGSGYTLDMRRPNLFCRDAAVRRPRLLHKPTVADDERLAGQRVALEAGEKQYRLGDVFGGGEFAVDRVLQHDVLDHIFLADAELLGLLGDLLVDERCADKAGADDIGANIMFGALLGDDLAQSDQPMLRRDIGRFQHRGL